MWLQKNKDQKKTQQDRLKMTKHHPKESQESVIKDCLVTLLSCPGQTWIFVFVSGFAL